MQATLTTRCTLARATSARRTIGAARRAAVVVRAQQQEVQTEAAEPVAVEAAAPAAAAVEAAPAAAAAAAAAPFSILGATQELINGRAAMLGFLIAIGTELASNQSVWSQIAGKYVDRELVEQPIGMSTLYYGFVVVMLAYASFMPRLQGLEPKDRQFGPFSAAAELANGRAAMLGFLALLAVEFFRGNVALF